jgi:hypothetical protein
MSDADDRQMEPGSTTEDAWDGAAARPGGPAGKEPDVLLDVPELRVDEISLEVQDLRARVSLEADVLELLRLHVGVDAALGSVQLTIKGVEAKVLLKVHLDNVARILDRVLTTIDDNPEIVERLTEHVGQAVEGVGTGAGRAVGDLGVTTGSAVEELGEGARTAVGDVGRGAGRAAEDVGAGAAGAVEDVGENAGTAVEDLSDDTSEDYADDEPVPPRRGERDAEAQPRRRRRESTGGRSRKASRSSRDRGRDES